VECKSSSVIFKIIFVSPEILTEISSAQKSHNSWFNLPSIAIFNIRLLSSLSSKAVAIISPCLISDNVNASKNSAFKIQDNEWF
jgi:hypothetical protein